MRAGSDGIRKRRHVGSRFGRRAAVVTVLLAAALGLAWQATGSLRPVASTGNEVACNAEPGVEHHFVVSWERDDKPTASPNEALSDAPAIPAIPTTGEGNGNASVRIFPDLNAYSEKDSTDAGFTYADYRRRVVAVVQWSGECPPDEMHFRLWDVDDPTDDDGPIDDNDPLVNGVRKPVGDDNNDKNSWHFAHENGSHIVSVGRGTIVRFDSGAGGFKVETLQGEGSGCLYKVEATVGLRPGDNYRFAASASRQEIEAMTQEDADLAVATDTRHISRILTVWRRLHLELDSMVFDYDNRVIEHIGAAYTRLPPHAGESEAIMSDWGCPDTGRYEGGRTLAIQHFREFEIATNDAVSVCVTGDISSCAQDDAIITDDDNIISPRKVDTSLVNTKFAPAFIEAVEDDRVSSMDAPFLFSSKNPLDACVPRRQERTSASYWVSLLLTGHQAYAESDDISSICSSVDGDPDIWYHIHDGVFPTHGDEGLVFGRTCVGHGMKYNASVIFLEAIREHVSWFDGGLIEGEEYSCTRPELEKRTVVHELGHHFFLPDTNDNSIMMSSRFKSTDVFTEQQLLTIRSLDYIAFETQP
jgi:hypothetical protein